jgi:glutamyl-Q tRNA(Asp) synthetase
MDDLDAARQVSGMAEDIRVTLERFSLVWDGEVAFQSRSRDAYCEAFEKLVGLGAVYPCGCSRKEIAQAASAPHPDDDCLPYPGTCRDGMRPDALVRSWRVRMPDEDICFDDLRHGRICRNPAAGCGDMAVRRGDGEFAYQLAVVVDDHLTGVNQVARGDDLLASTPRQIWLQRLLGYPQPEYCHLPLVTGPGGAKLSKRDNLVSDRLGGWRGRESLLLLSMLRFLGQAPPEEMAVAGCAEILAWGTENFDIQRLPDTGGELVA